MSAPPPATAPRWEPTAVTCADGVVLRGRLVLPAGEPRAAVQFNPGTAARLRFYEPFLTFLARRGFACSLVDYRGSGASVPPGGLRDCRYSYVEYGTQDLPAVRDHLRVRFPGLPLLMVGHSAGGQQLPFSGDLSGVRGALLFAVSTGYRPGLAPYYRPQSWLFFRAFLPVSLRLTGYCAAARLGLMEDLPAGVALQWRRWCDSPDYCFDARFRGDVPAVDWAALDFPVRHVHALTDEISTARNVATFWRHWRPAGGVEQHAFAPADYGLAAPVRHFDYFRERLFGDTLWREAAAWLDARID